MSHEYEPVLAQLSFDCICLNPKKVINLYNVFIMFESSKNHKSIIFFSDKNNFVD